MAPEHVRYVQDWMREHVGDGVQTARPGDTWHTVLARLRPPALVRAAWLLLENHLQRGTSLSLAPSVAEVYLADPDAWPAGACEGCGYPMPTRSTLRPDGTYRHVGWYMGECPVCGLDNHPDQDGEEGTTR
jgi:hypothetical protein